MSSWGLSAPEHDEPQAQVRRVREEVRDCVAVSMCTLLASTVVAVSLTLVAKFVG
jgi:hypothetical protein